MKKLLILMLSTLALCAPSYGARLFNGTSDTLQAASIDLSGTNFISVAFWLYWDSYVNDNDFCMEFTADVAANNGFAFNPNHVSGQFSVAYNVSGAGSFTQRIFGRPSAATWHHYIVEMDGRDNPDSWTVYVDGASQTLNLGTDANGTGNFANSTLNFMSRNATTFFGAGRICEVAIYPSRILTQVDATALAQGFSPMLVKPTDKPYYWPLIGRTSPEPELFYGKTATVTGAVQVVHPRIIYPTK